MSYRTCIKCGAILLQKVIYNSTDGIICDACLPCDKLETQCWICPKCHDDHAQGADCAIIEERDFYPVLDDHSFIAEKYRELIVEKKELLIRIEELEAIIDREEWNK